MTSSRASQRDKSPLDPALMAKACRDLAAKYRWEATTGAGPVTMTGGGNETRNTISRAEAADRLDQQADRWESELRTGVPNLIDRAALGE